jgi:hypothetical protein
LFAAVLLLVCHEPGSGASTPEELIRPIQEQWAEIKYQVSRRSSRPRAIVQAGRPGTQDRRRATRTLSEPLIWEGIVLSSEAGAKGGLGALASGQGSAGSVWTKR